jgi:ribosome recycling factor
VNPSNDGKVIRLVIPELTEERRKDLTKLVHKSARRRRSPSAPSAGTRWNTSRSCKKTARSPRTTDQGGKEDAGSDRRGVKGVDELAAKKEKEIMEV